MSSNGRWLLLALLPSCAGRSSRELFFPEGEVRSVEIHVAAGDLAIQTGPVLRVERTLWGIQSARTVSHRVEEGVLVLDGRCVPWVPCAVDMAVQVPSGLPVSVTLGSGDVAVTGVARLTLSLGSGSADLAADGPIDAAVGVGDVQLRPAPGAESRVAVADGDVRVEVAEEGWTVSADGADVALAGVREGEGGESHLELLAPAGRVEVVRGAPVAGR